MAEFIVLAIIMHGNPGHLVFSAAASVVPAFMAGLKYDPDIQARVSSMFPNYASGMPATPAATRAVAGVWMSAGTVGVIACGLLAAVHSGLHVNLAEATRGWVHDRVFDILTGGLGAAFSALAVAGVWRRLSS